MTDILAAAERHRAELAAGEARAAARMVRSYGQAWAATKAQLDRVLAQIARARAAGVEVRGGWLYQERRLTNVLGTLEARLRRFAVLAADETMAAQAAAAGAAQAHVVRAIAAQDPSLAADLERAPTGALDALVGNLSDGSPLPALFGTFPAEAGRALERTLVAGVARGLGPRAMLAEARGALGANLTRALLVLRTESLRAARESARLGMAANPGIVAGWVWTCAMTARSCAACMAMHGRIFPTSERMGTHPNCRCSLSPISHSWADLGFAEVPDVPRPQSGPERFAGFEPRLQRAVLGRAKYDAWRRGEITLEDLVGRRDDPRWGTTRYERSLREIRAARALGPDVDETWRLGTELDPALARARARQWLGRRAARR